MTIGHASERHTGEPPVRDQHTRDRNANDQHTSEPAFRAESTQRYLAPDVVSHRIANPLVRALVRLGIGARGGRILHVRGRRTGEWRSTPVNPLSLDGERYLVAPRGRTEWVRNLRAAGTGRLQLGRRFEEFTATEVDDADKAPIIRAYLDLWAMETKRFFEGLDATSSDEDIAAIASGFPVFRIEASRGV
jgi:deazaflavin-dependent oxidoreductase (nitroreductase family)